ncbi:cytochrome oxidase c subunit VIb-domain-containing protein [Sphaerosporella brunnea]|uniref:Cytochrome oxidase c subunit VIb-domain-containing protein n=1 Tax=Sphaerosporella brunnea TaxID=1250544 RepID=A0A5J5EKP2_9PEZI|nr:cytochrome oxidase c subunit VIb-domain-containing protein [Sphaerosporella brunnea]KAA8896196.1 cytochrome oxidase c subunit VIb-domain-containing protein [Sphaerosporella brunnea]
MGLFTSTTTTPAPSTPTPPTRTQRAKCWEARDAFFRCLDTAGIVDAIKDSTAAKTSCSGEMAAFEKECVASWVEYFKKRRVMEHNREQMLKGLQKEGAKKME